MSRKFSAPPGRLLSCARCNLWRSKLWILAIVRVVVENLLISFNMSIVTSWAIPLLIWVVDTMINADNCIWIRRLELDLPTCWRPITLLHSMYLVFVFTCSWSARHRWLHLHIILHLWRLISDYLFCSPQTIDDLVVLHHEWLAAWFLLGGKVW